MNGNKQSCVWEVNIKKDNPLKPNAFMSQAFTLDQSGGYMLLCHSQNNGGNIYKVIYIYILNLCLMSAVPKLFWLAAPFSNQGFLGAFFSCPSMVYHKKYKN